MIRHLQLFSAMGEAMVLPENEGDRDEKKDGKKRNNQQTVAKKAVCLLQLALVTVDNDGQTIRYFDDAQAAIIEFCIVE